VKDNTNVWRLKALAAENELQKTYYSAGVGTQRGERVRGGLYGIGINEEVIAAYEWLIENYVDGAYIYIFGFSRGAFTARSLAGFISTCGLLKRGSPIPVEQLYGHYRKRDITILSLLKKAESLTQDERWIRKYSRAAPVFFQGVWDTVGSLGTPFPFLPRVSKKSFSFLETDLHINDSYGFHALAIDEHRTAFEPTLWNKTISKTGLNTPERELTRVEQRWFIGAHSNVGGGYRNDLLAQLPLKWIMEKAELHGLIFLDDIGIEEEFLSCPIRDSLSEMLGGVPKILLQGGRPHYRTIGIAPVENSGEIVHSINETIDKSVFDYWNANSNYRPQNLADWAKRRDIDLAKLSRSVHTQDTQLVVD